MNAVVLPEPPPRVLVVDDDEMLRLLFERRLSHAGCIVEECDRGATALDILRRQTFDIVLLDLHMPELDGFATLTEIKARHRNLPVVMLTADAAVENVVRAVQIGAYDYLEKPPDGWKLLNAVKRATDAGRMARQLAELSIPTDEPAPMGMVGSAATMVRLRREIERVSATDISVYVRGESGSGKELVAKAIHDRSERREGPLVAINCASIPETLQESELFGHERGAFTGATSRHAGVFERADGGTLMLDEVAELSLTLQAKLLRVLQERRYQRVGGQTELETDFRLVVATHRQLLDEVAAGRFREDLYYRLVVYELEIPPLRDRHGDIPLLLSFFLKRFDPSGEISFAAPLLKRLETYAWPGNVRELENAVQRMVVSCHAGVIEERDAPPRIRAAFAEQLPGEETQANPVEEPKAKADTSVHLTVSPNEANAEEESAPTPDLRTSEMNLAEVEKRVIAATMAQYDNNRSIVAKKLGIGRTTLYRKLKEYSLDAGEE